MLGTPFLISQYLDLLQFLSDGCELGNRNSCVYGPLVTLPRVVILGVWRLSDGPNGRAVLSVMSGTNRMY
jgi:hypothetical protein